jgi:hypothetical protein
MPILLFPSYLRGHQIGGATKNLGGWFDAGIEVALASSCEAVTSVDRYEEFSQCQNGSRRGRMSDSAVCTSVALLIQGSVRDDVAEGGANGEVRPKTFFQWG